MFQVKHLYERHVGLKMKGIKEVLILFHALERYETCYNCHFVFVPDITLIDKCQIRKMYNCSTGLVSAKIKIECRLLNRPT